MAQPIRPQNKQIVDPKTGRIALEWDAYFARLEQLLAAQFAGGVTSFEGRTGIVVGASGDYTASEITNVAAGNIVATTVQAAIDELDSEKAATSHSHAASDITSGTFDDARIAESNVTQHEAAIDHDALTKFVSDEHVAHSGVTLTAGAGLTGGGDITASRSFAVGAGSGITVNADDVAITAGGVGTTQLADNNVTMAKLEDAEAWTLLLRNAGTTGDPDYVKISALTDAGGFGTGDKLIIEEASGELRKIDYDDLPGGSSSGGWTYDSEVSLSGTQTNVSTAIPSGVNDIEIFILEPTSASSNVLLGIQIGPSGGFVTTGYVSASELIAGSGGTTSTSQFVITDNSLYDPGAGDVLYGVFKLRHYGSNIWFGEYQVQYQDGNQMVGVGHITLAGEITQVRINSSAALTGGTAKLRYM